MVIVSGKFSPSASSSLLDISTTTRRRLPQPHRPRPLHDPSLYYQHTPDTPSPQHYPQPSFVDRYLFTRERSHHIRKFVHSQSPTRPCRTDVGESASRGTASPGPIYSPASGLDEILNNRTRRTILPLPKQSAKTIKIKEEESSPSLLLCLSSSSPPPPPLPFSGDDAPCAVIMGVSRTTPKTTSRLLVEEEEKQKTKNHSIHHRQQKSKATLYGLQLRSRLHGARAASPHPTFGAPRNDLRMVELLRRRRNNSATPGPGAYMTSATPTNDGRGGLHNTTKCFVKYDNKRGQGGEGCCAPLVDNSLPTSLILLPSPCSYNPADTLTRPRSPAPLAYLTSS
eukprot:PhM_4_TR9799/c4_g1_i1/m.24040